MCRSERPIVRELRNLLYEIDELKEKMELVEEKLKVKFILDKNTGEWVITKKG